MKTSMGLCGATGKTPNIEVGYVKQVNYNDKAKVIITGTRENPILNFEIPKGKDGAKLIIKEYFNGDITVLNNLRDLPQEVSDEHNKTVMSVNGIKELLDKVNEITRDYKLKDGELSSKIESEKETLKNLITTLENTLISKINNINDVKIPKIENDINKNSTDISLNTQDINTLKSENEKLKEVNKKLNEALDSTLIYVDKEGEEIKEYTTIAPIKNLKIKGKTVVTDAPTETNENNKRIESSGELEGNKINILSNNKNLFNIDKFLKSNENKAFYSTDGFGNIIINSLDYRSSTDDLNACFKLKKNTSYVINCSLSSSKLRLLVKQSNGEWVNITPPQEGIFNSGDLGIVLLKFIEDNNYPLKVYNIQLEEGTKATDYSEPKEDKKEISFNLDGGLKSLPNGVADTIEQKDNGFYLVQRVGKIVLNGQDLSWSVLNNDKTNTINFVCSGINSTKENDINIICNSFNVGIMGYGDDVESLFKSLNGVYISILRSRLSTQDVNGLKAWLQANPTTVYYELVTALETKLNIDNNLQTFKDLTYITSENNIKPTLNVSLSKSINSIIDEIKRKVYALDTPNIKEEV